MGAVAMLDALGFRGIWKRESLNALEGSLETLVATLRRDIDELIQKIAISKPVIEARFLSDTVVFTVAHDVPFSGKGGGGSDGVAAGGFPIAPFSVEVAAAFSSLLQARSALSAIPLAFRGAIGFGEFYVKENFLIGPAVDEVAVAHQEANGAIVFMLPSAASALALHPPTLRDRGLLPRVLIPDFRVPLKRLRHVVAPVVNPLALPGSPEDLSDRILRTFGNPRLFSSVWWKLRATTCLLGVAEKQLSRSGASQ